MEYLPEKLLLHIIKFLALSNLSDIDNKFIGFSKLKWISIDEIEDFEDEGINCDSLKKMHEEYHHRDGYYLPLRNLYATCKAFGFLSEYEYICIEKGEFYHNIATRDINGIRCGMNYDLNGHVIIGCSSYTNGILLLQNKATTDTSYQYRFINGKKYYEYENCNIWQNEYDDKCQNCLNLKHMENEIFEKDPDIQKIIKSKYDNNTVIIRPKFKIFSIEFSTEGYEELSNDDF